MMIWHNGAFKAAETPVFTAQDRVRLGDGVFDTMLCLLQADSASSAHDTGAGFKLCFGAAHFERLQRHAAVMGMDVPFFSSYESFAQTVLELLDRNRKALDGNHTAPQPVALNTILSRGDAPRGLMPPDQPSYTLVLRVSTVPDRLPDVHAGIARNVTRNEGSPLSRIKSFGYGESILALREVCGQNQNQNDTYNEALMLNNRSRICCASASNIFVLSDDLQNLYTPPLQDGVLDGVLRTALLHHFPDRVIEKSLSEQDISAAQGIFLGNSIRGLYPIKSLNGKRLDIDYDAALQSLGIDKFFHLD
jgi:branched-chain amino acid aminotransferase